MTGFLPNLMPLCDKIVRASRVFPLRKTGQLGRSEFGSLCRLTLFGSGCYSRRVPWDAGTL